MKANKCRMIRNSIRPEVFDLRSDFIAIKRKTVDNTIRLTPNGLETTDKTNPTSMSTHDTSFNTRTGIMTKEKVIALTT